MIMKSFLKKVKQRTEKEALRVGMSYILTSGLTSLAAGKTLSNGHAEITLPKPKVG